MTVMVLFIFSVNYFFRTQSDRLIKDRLSAEKDLQQQLMLGQIALHAEAEFAAAEDVLELTAQIPDVRDITPKCHGRIVFAHNSTKTLFGDIGRVDGKGVISCSSNEGMLGMSTLQYPHIKNVFDDRNHRPVLSRILPSDATGRSRPVLSYHIPVHDESGRFSGTLGGQIELERLEKAVLGMFAGKNLEVLIVDDNGDILIHPKNASYVGKNILWDKELGLTATNWPEILEAAKKGGLEGQTHTTADESVYVLTTSAKMPDGRRLIVATEVDGDESLAEYGVASLIRQYNNMFFITLGFIIFLVMFSGFYIDYTVFRPLREMTSVISRISRGDIAVSIDDGLKSKDDEIGELSRAFERTLVSLKLAMSMTSPELQKNAKRPADEGKGEDKTGPDK